MSGHLRVPRRLGTVIPVDGEQTLRLHLRTTPTVGSTLCGLISPPTDIEAPTSWDDENGSACVECLRILAGFDEFAAARWRAGEGLPL